MIRAIIIDDFLQAQQLLQADLASYCPRVNIVGTADGVISGAKLIKNSSFDLLFLDIELGDGTGFDLLQILPEISFKIIFTTASDQHAIRAFRFSAIDYLLKPIDPEKLKSAVDKIDLDSDAKVDVLLEHWRDREKLKRLALHNSDKILIATLENIVRCESENNYTTFHFVDGTTFLVSKTLKYYEQILTELGFLRVHQSHLVNMVHVLAFDKGEGGFLVMHGQTQIPVAVRKRTILMSVIEKMGH